MTKKQVSDGHIPTKGVEVKNDFKYPANDIWYNRMYSLERLAKTANAESITSQTISDLRFIARGDKDRRIKKLASSMIRSYEKKGDFSGTKPYEEMQAEKVRLTIQTSTNFGYNPPDIWYVREEALENLVRNQGEISDGLVKDLKLVAKKDDDWRIKELASSLIRSYEKKGDFSRTEPYKEMKNEELRLTIQIFSDLGYDPKEVWWRRQNALKDLVTNHSEVSGGIVKDLRAIAQKDDDSRIRRLAFSIIRSYKKNGDFNSVNIY